MFALSDNVSMMITTMTNTNTSATLLNPINVKCWNVATNKEAHFQFSSEIEFINFRKNTKGVYTILSVQF